MIVILLIIMISMTNATNKVCFVFFLWCVLGCNREGIALNKLAKLSSFGNVFFAGEVLNIDAETGGFNFQSAWTTAFIAAKAITS